MVVEGGAACCLLSWWFGSGSTRGHKNFRREWGAAGAVACGFLGARRRRTVFVRARRLRGFSPKLSCPVCLNYFSLSFSAPNTPALIRLVKLFVRGVPWRCRRLVGEVCEGDQASRSEEQSPSHHGGAVSTAAIEAALILQVRKGRREEGTLDKRRECPNRAKTNTMGEGLICFLSTSTPTLGRWGGASQH